jgi:chemotaxis protein histidine kinase CheA
MSKSRQAKADVITYGDHEVITPDHSRMRQYVRQATPEEEADDPVARADAALAQLSSDFSAWMNEECERLDSARQKVREAGLSKHNQRELFIAAHDVKGDASTFGYPLVVPAADSLCRLLDLAPDTKRIPITIIDQHVDAVRAIYREYARDDINQIAEALTSKLRGVTDEFLVRENRSRPDKLKLVMAPSIQPGAGDP